MRHGPAGPTLKDQEADDARELTADGRRAVEAVVDEFLETSPAPRFIYASPLPRAQQTAAILAKAAGVDEVETADELHPNEREVLRAFLRDCLADEDMRRIAIVGHSDNLDPLLAELGDTEKLAKGEIRRYRIERDMTNLEERDSVKPSDVDLTDEY